MARYVRAWHAQDVPSLVAVLQEDAYTAMPPTPLRARVVDQDVNAIGSGKAGARRPSGSDAERDYPRPTAGVW